MKRALIGAYLFAFVLILTVGLAGATVSYKNNSMKTDYFLGEKVSGRFNVSFSNQKIDSLITSNFNGSIKLIDFLENNSFSEGEDFNCTINGCGRGYISSGEITNVSVSGLKTVGLKIVGNSIDSINSVSFNVADNSGSSCSNPITIKIGDNPDYLIANGKYTNQVCGAKNYGCFDTSLSSYQEAYLSSQWLCENITLPSAPAYKIGAKIKDKTKGDSTQMRMKMLNQRGDILGDDGCILPAYPSNTPEAELECIINYTSYKTQSYFVCVMADVNPSDISSMGPDYKIKMEQSGGKCGVSESGNPSGRDFEIFARGMQFSPLNLNINDSYFEDKFGVSLGDYVNDYLFDNYPKNGNGYKCDPECIVPIELNGTGTISFSNAHTIYSDSGVLVPTDKIYNLELKDSELTSGYLNLDLEKAGFTIGKSDDKFILYLDGTQVFKKDINVEAGFDFEVNPKFVLIGRNTEFIATSAKNITYTKWEFGNNENVESNSRKSTHTYDASGQFDVLVTAKIGNLTSKKIFSITVGNAKDSANLTLKDYRVRIGNLSAQINSYPAWTKTEIEKVVKVVEMNATLSQLERDFKDAVNESDYEDIVSQLIALHVPYSILKSESGRLPLAVGFNNMDVSHIEEISGGSANDTEQLQGAILDWIDKNYNADVDYEVVTALGDAEKSDIYTKFKITLTQKGTDGAAGYLIIDYPTDGIVFLEQAGARSVGSATAIPISGTKTIEFLIPEKISVEDLGAYLSPEISAFNIDNRPICEGADCPQPVFPWTTFGIGMGILILVTLIVYIILQEWYKRNYERQLFRNKDDLYNMINFIYNGRHSGLSDGDIREKLRRSGWSGEQITYAFRKIDGKRTGMFEIPLFKSSENKKVREEIEKRHGGQIDARFIKRPQF